MKVFGRRRREAAEADEEDIERVDESRAESDWNDEEPDDAVDDLDGPSGDAGDGVAGEGGVGPWDAGEVYPQRERIDLGSLQIPVGPDLEVQLNVADDQIVAVTVVHGENAMQVQPFAAPKRSGLWDDVRHEIIEELGTAGGSGEEVDGPFGPEIRAQVPVESPSGGGGTALQLARFIGADGPRWFLRGVISGTGVATPELTRPLEEAFAGIVVIRGEHPLPPRDPLEIRLPAEARQALDEQMAAAAERPSLDPFERGPEITETR